MKEYTHDFYSSRHRATIHSANRILALLLDVIPPVRSAIDVGCGTGTWLSVLNGWGVKEIQGVDGGWVEKRLLAIPAERFKEVDLGRSIVRMPRRYDLAISLEVAEHLSPMRARDFVQSLVELSDFVLFSAAVPFQGGKNHVNEQWARYWFELFAGFDYVPYDFIRPRVWNDEGIPFWYKQNIFFFAKKERQEDVDVAGLGLSPGSLPLTAIHPGLYRAKVRKIGNASSVKGSWELFRRALKKATRAWIVRTTARIGRRRF